MKGGKLVVFMVFLFVFGLTFVNADPAAPSPPGDRTVDALHYLTGCQDGIIDGELYYCDQIYRVVDDRPIQYCTTDDRISSFDDCPQPQEWEEFDGSWDDYVSQWNEDGEVYPEGDVEYFMRHAFDPNDNIGSGWDGSLEDSDDMPNDVDSLKVCGTPEDPILYDPDVVGNRHDCGSGATSHIETVDRDELDLGGGGVQMVCGDPEEDVAVSDGTSIPSEHQDAPFLDQEKIESMNLNTLESISVNEDDSVCPSIQGLSQRHPTGDINTGYSLSPGGYASIGTPAFESEQDMYLSMYMTILACMNRVPFARLQNEMTLDDSIDIDEVYGEGYTEKTGLYAAHHNVYYGDDGDQFGRLDEIEMPSQKSFKLVYEPENELRSYRLWAWRERFAEALNKVVEEENLELPGEDFDEGDRYNITEIAEGQHDGLSLEDLWLGPDYLMGAEAPDPDDDQVEMDEDTTITRVLSESCEVDIRDSELEFDDIYEIESEFENEISTFEDYCGLEDTDRLNYVTIDTFNEVVSSGSEEVEEKDPYFIEVDTGGLDMGYSSVEDGTVSNVSDFNEDDIDVAEDFLDKEEGERLEIIDSNNEELDESVFSETERIEIVSLGDMEEGENKFEVVIDDIEYRRPYKGEEIADRDLDDIIPYIREWTDVNSRVIDGAPMKQEDDGRTIRIISIEDMEESGEYEIEIETESWLVEDEEGYHGYLKMDVIYEQILDTSWNWRALEQVNMTNFARCMYNWEDCLENTVELEGVAHDGTEIGDAGFGPPEDSFVFDWSEDLFEEENSPLDQLEDSITGDYQDGEMDEDVYQSLTDSLEDQSFDKQFDGAMGKEQDTEIESFHVFRRCEEDDSWLNKEYEGSNFEDQEFLCPDDKEEIAFCQEDGAPTHYSNIPDEIISYHFEYSLEMLEDDYFVCKKEEDESFPIWREDTYPPELEDYRVLVEGEEDWDTVSSGDEATIEAEAFDKESGIESLSLCEEQDCSNKICEENFDGEREQPVEIECSESWDDYDVKALHLNSEDRQGNEGKHHLESIEIMLETGQECENDDQCITNNCEEPGVCEPLYDSPELELIE